MAAAETRLKTSSSKKNFRTRTPISSKKIFLKRFCKKHKARSRKREIGKNLYQFPKSRRAD